MNILAVSHCYLMFDHRFNGLEVRADDDDKTPVLCKALATA